MHFNGDGVRSAITVPFDARNVEEFNFVFYYGDNCAVETHGSEVRVAVSNDFGVSWNVVKIIGKFT